MYNQIYSSIYQFKYFFLIPIDFLVFLRSCINNIQYITILQDNIFFASVLSTIKWSEFFTDVVHPTESNVRN